MPSRMPDVELFGHWICPYSTRVEFTLHHRAINHQLTEVPPTAVRPTGFVVPDTFIKHSPRGEIPMIRVGDEHLADSLPILIWLEDKFTETAMLPVEDEQRAHVLSRMSEVDALVFPPMIGVYYGIEEESIDASADLLSRGLNTISTWLGDGWLAGSGLTLVEAVLIPLYVRLEGLRRLGFSHPLPFALDEHRSACEALPAFDAVRWSAAQNEEFVRNFEHHRARSRT